MNENNNALLITDSILFLFMAVPVLYLFVCALFSLGKYKNPYPAAKTNHRFLVVFTVLRNGKEVIESINHFLDTQHYPREKYDIAVAATQLSEADLLTLLQMPVNIVVPDKDQCTKVYAIQQVMERYSPNEYDMIVLFNSDNKVVPEALRLFNNAYYSGCDAIQAHRMTENLTTSIAVLNATSEEINNNIFRKAYTYGVFIRPDRFRHGIRFQDVPRDSSHAERLGHKQSYGNGTLTAKHIYRISGRGCLLQQKRRKRQWLRSPASGGLRSQYSSALFAIKHPLAMLRGEWDYCNKLFQWLLPSRFLLIALILFFTAVITIMDWTLCLKWYLLLAAIALTFLMALPEGEIARRFRKAIWALPILMFESIFSHILRFKKRENKQ